MENSLDIIDIFRKISAKSFKAGTQNFILEQSETSKPVSFIRKNIQNTLFDYQADLIVSCLYFFGSPGISKALLTLPTGAGKTRTVSVACLRTLDSFPSLKIAWLAPTKELLEQAHNTFYQLWLENGNYKDLTISKSYGKYKDENLLLTTPHEIFASTGHVKKFDIIVFDEAHQSIAKTFNESILLISKESTKVLGMSATPGRVIEGESSSLVDYFQNNLIRSNILGETPVKFLQNRHVLSKPKFISLGESNLDQDHRIELVARKIKSLGSNEKSLVFSHSIEQGKKFTLLLEFIGVRALFIEGDMSREERDSVLRTFEYGRCSVIVNQKLLSTGYDCPSVENIFLLSKISSPIMFEQIIGRAARGTLLGGTSNSKIFDFDNHLRIHGEPNSYKRYADLGWQDNSDLSRGLM